MAQNLQVGEAVFVARSRLGLNLNSPSAFHQTTVRELVDRSIKVDVPGGEWSKQVASSAVHRNIGVLIFRIGDYQTELSLLDQLAKSVLQFFRLMLPDDMIRLCEIRTVSELQHYWGQLHAAFSHVVVIGHGKEDGILFGSDDWVGAEQLMSVLAAANPSPKTFVSLCCKTGYAGFAKKFSAAEVCQALVAPFHSVHGAVASQFCQSFFGFHLLDGDTARIAFKHAGPSIPGGSHSRLWQDGELTDGDN